jgi:hypothetical protein
VQVVLAGDLDATPDAASVRFWRGRQSLGSMSVCYRDAWGSTHPDEPGHTFTAENPLVTAENWDWELELAGGSTTCSCSAPTTAPPSTSATASASSTSPWTGFGAATTSAS